MTEPKPKRPRGRPRVTDPAEDRIRIRVTPAEKAKYRAAADRDGATLSGWVKAILDREAG
jgi:uncharacterized protein (DUF1778 family)